MYSWKNITKFCDKHKIKMITSLLSCKQETRYEMLLYPLGKTHALGVLGSHIRKTHTNRKQAGACLEYVSHDLNHC